MRELGAIEERVRDLNDALTLILNETLIALGLLAAGSPARAHLIEVEHAALRAASCGREILVADLLNRRSRGC